MRDVSLALTHLFYVEKSNFDVLIYDTQSQHKLDTTRLRLIL